MQAEPKQQRGRVTQERLPRLVTLNAQPEPISFDTARTAVIVVDMQNDFGTEGGMFQRAGIDISMIRRAIAPTARALAAARRAGIKIVYLKMAFKFDLSDAGSEGCPNRVRHVGKFKVGAPVSAPNGILSRILIRDTWNTDILVELAPQSADLVLYKHRFSGFFETELHSVLQASGINSLIVAGCTTSVCVESTIRDAMFRDYRAVLLADCAGEPIGYGLPRSNHDASLLSIQTSLGWVAHSDDLIRCLQVRSRSAT